MFSNTQDAGKEIYAGRYLRALKQIRSWSWLRSRGRGKRKLTNVAEAETERPWAGVAEWLRAAHSLLDDKTVVLARNADR
jgi:hypothetical protein